MLSIENLLTMKPKIRLKHLKLEIAQDKRAVQGKRRKIDEIILIVY